MSAEPHPTRLTPDRLLSAVASMRRVRHGLDPQEVGTLLSAAATQMGAVAHERDAALREVDRVKAHLRAWQSEHAATCKLPPAAGTGAHRRGESSVHSPEGTKY